MGQLVPLTPADIAEVMRIERLPGYDAFIGQFSADEHAAELASPDARYLGYRQGAGLAGFVIVQAFTAPTVLLRRIAVDDTGRGTGSALFRAAVDWIFANTPAQAVKLHVRPENHRARHIYVREGFTRHGDDPATEYLSVTRARWVG
ncbi:GNAT family N-acetyltransferase [Phenylobacterium sp. LjRoot164]|uniref:GNAT family N-acetyltransferase n=1 Tax=unclassified Phenylobacterium TaxID=2640670 RepID=UPI003ECF54F5